MYPFCFLCPAAIVKPLRFLPRDLFGSSKYVVMRRHRTDLLTSTTSISQSCQKLCAGIALHTIFRVCKVGSTEKRSTIKPKILPLFRVVDCFVSTV